MIRNPILAVCIRLVVLLTMVLLGTSCSPSQAAGTVIKIESPSSPVQVNESVTVPVRVANIADLTAIEVHLSFNAALLEVVSVTAGDFLQADFPVQNTFDNTAGTIDYAAAQINAAPATGSGTLFEIVFRAKASGDALIHFREIPAAPAGVLLSDANGLAIKVSLTDGKVSVQ